MLGFISTDILSDIADAIREKTGEIEGITPSAMADAILSISGGGDGYQPDVSPQYHWDEAMRVATEINEWKQSHENSMIFGAISDHHVTTTNASYNTLTVESIKRAVFGVQTVARLSNADFIISMGDYSWETSMDTDEGYANARFVGNTIGEPEGLLRYRLVGNHDKSRSTEKTYSLIGSHNTFDAYGAVQARGFGYKDFTDKKVRVIFLNTTDYLNDSGGHAMSYDQKDFLMRALDLSDKTGYGDWQILLLSHIPLDFYPGDYNTATDLLAILSAYETGGTADITVNDAYALNEDPSDYLTFYQGHLVKSYVGINNPRIIANIHGHVHNDVTGEVSGTGIKRLATPNSCFYMNKTTSYPDNGDYSISAERGQQIAKVAESARDTSVAFYCIDLDEETIYAFSYGAGLDRQVSYSTITHTVTYTLSGCTSSNTASSVSYNSSYSTTLTPTDQYGVLSSVAVTMGGTDITSQCYSNDTVYIASVTGAIVITATATVPHWEQAVSDLVVAPRSILHMPPGTNNISEIVLLNSNTDIAIGVSASNDISRTDRESHAWNLMPVPARASKVTVSCSDSTLDNVLFRTAVVSGSSYTRMDERTFSSVMYYSFTPGSINYIGISMRRADGESVPWGFNDSQVTVTFSND